MKKYLHICSTLKPGGVTNFVKGIQRGNECSDSQHYIAVYNCDQKVLDENLINISSHRFNIIKDIRFARDVMLNYKKVFVHSADYLLMFAFYLMNIDCTFFQHGMSVSHGPKIKRQLKKIWFSLLPILFNTKVICSSEYAVKKSRSLGIKLADKRVRIIQFGTDLPRRNGITIREKNQPIIIGTAGRLAEIKRFDLLLKSLINYSAKKELEIRIAGDGPEKEKLISIAEKIQNQKIKIRFLGVVDDMVSFYDDLDLFVFPSHNESYGLVVLEALYRNVPVALFEDLGGALHLIEDRKNGFIFKEIRNGLCELWEILNSDDRKLNEMKKNISTSDLREFDINKTRIQIEARE